MAALAALIANQGYYPARRGRFGVVGPGQKRRELGIHHGNYDWPEVIPSEKPPRMYHTNTIKAKGRL